MVYQQHMIIVGAGIIGLSTAYALLTQGMQRVTVLEQVSVDHRRGMEGKGPGANREDLA